MQEIALSCGNMLRECIRYEALAKILLHSGTNFIELFTAVIYKWECYDNTYDDNTYL
jgi:hypothetical protein